MDVSKTFLNKINIMLKCISQLRIYKYLLGDLRMKLLLENVMKMNLMI